MTVGLNKNAHPKGFAQVYGDLMDSSQFRAIYRQCKDVLVVYVLIRMELRKNKKRDQRRGIVYRNNGELKLPLRQLAPFMAPATAIKAFDLLERAGFIDCTQRGHWPKIPSEYAISDRWLKLEAVKSGKAEPYRLRGRALQLHNTKATSSKRARARSQDSVVESRSASTVEAMKPPQKPEIASTVEAMTPRTASTVEATQLQPLKEGIPSNEPVAQPAEAVR